MSDLQDSIKAMANTGLPLEHRKKMIIDIIAGADKEQTAELFEAMTAPALSKEAEETMEEINDMVKNLKRAPMKPATFLWLSAMEDADKSPYALVMMDDGEMGYMVVHDQVSANKMKLGDRVTVDGKATILIGKLNEDSHGFGREAKYERKLDSRHIEITQQDQRYVVLATHKLMNKIDSNKINPGGLVITSSGDRVATDAVPEADNLSHYRFLDRGLIPDVLVDRDIGAPPKVIDAVSRHVREEMTRPELRRRFRLRPCITRLLSGVSGSGKTLAVQAIHRRLYDIMSEITSTPMKELPHRVFRFKTSQVLSMWLGESDKNADRLFDEVEKLAQELYTNHKGKEFRLPVMVVMEEAEGMGRQRGTSGDSVYDRILSTLLQRLDPNRAGLSDQLVVFLSTTNEPHLVDPAFLRRIGGSVEHFGRLDQSAFTEVIKKHVEGLPAATDDGKSQKKLWNEIIGELESWLYEGDSRGIVELLISGRGSLIKYRRDFLTGALIDRAVQESSTAAWEESLKQPEAGITITHLQAAIAQQVNHVAQQLTPQNAAHYLDLPEGCTVNKITNLK